ncbi:hypothetical protein F4678DRAFT_480629 [Xylaria arbuscula]|nr:hypothetical protein F4678DRAFT_480629 [Xylaria arbuscula]
MEETRNQDTSGQRDLAEPPCCFTLFSSLPPELRQIIWGLLIDSLQDIPELLIHEPSDFLRSSNSITPKVYTGFPALLHVNLEARSIAQKRFSFVDCPRAGCMVPVRLFRLDLDVLYIPWEAWRSFFLLKEFHYGANWLSHLQHIAVDICLSTNLTAFFRQAHHIPSVRTLQFVLPSNRGYFNPSSMLLFPNPISRCTLRPISAGEKVDEETSSTSTRLWTMPSYLDNVHKKALEAAEQAMRVAANQQARETIERFIRDRTSLVIEARVLTEFRRSGNGSSSSFVELGEDNVAELVLPVA